MKNEVLYFLSSFGYSLGFICVKVYLFHGVRWPCDHGSFPTERFSMSRKKQQHLTADATRKTPFDNRVAFVQGCKMPNKYGLQVHEAILLPRLVPHKYHTYYVLTLHAGRQPAAGFWGLAAEEESARRERRDSTPEQRTSRPRAIKSPMYARRGRSGTNRVIATALGDRRKDGHGERKTNISGGGLEL